MSCDVRGLIKNVLQGVKETLDPTFGLLEGIQDWAEECKEDESSVELRQLPNHLREVLPPTVSRLWSNAVHKVCEPPVRKSQDTMELTCNEKTPATQMICNEENLKEEGIAEIGSLSRGLEGYLDLTLRFFQLDGEIERSLGL